MWLQTCKPVNVYVSGYFGIHFVMKKSGLACHFKSSVLFVCVFQLHDDRMNRGFVPVI